MANSRYIREDGKAAVIVSHGFGSGFSSWNDRNMAVDGRIIEWLYEFGEVFPEEDEDYIMLDSTQISPFKDFLESIGYKDVSLYCLRDGKEGLTIHCLPVGTVFRINEYDGAESIEIFDTKSYIVL